jgi:hypothetical protein
MRPKPVYVVDLIRDVVTATQTAVLPELQAYNAFIQQINFIPGTVDEIYEVLTTMSQQASADGKQWPLFALLMSIPEKKAELSGDVKHGIGLDNTVELNILIARRGNNTDKTPARYTNNFKPVLYPIYLEFLNQLFLSTHFITELPNNIPHTKIDFPYYDADKGVNVFNSYVDAIQLKIKLKIRLPNAQYA